MCAGIRVSVIMAVHNGERWLVEAVRSIQTQSEDNIELVVVDDGSTDLTRSILDSLRREDPRIKLVAQPHCGLASALNQGLATAAAPLVARLDADDIAHSARLRRQADEMDARPDIAVLGTWAKVIDVEGRRVGSRRPPADHESLCRVLTMGNPMIHSTVMARTEAIRNAGGYRAEFVGAEDYDLWLRVSDRGRLANLPEELASYRSHRQGVSQGNAPQQALGVRLAQISANARCAGRDDSVSWFVDDLTGGCSSSPTEDQILSFYRWLDCDARFAGAQTSQNLSAELLALLNHNERRLLGRALIGRLLSLRASESVGAMQQIARMSIEAPVVLAKSLWSISK